MDCNRQVYEDLDTFFVGKEDLCESVSTQIPAKIRATLLCSSHKLDSSRVTNEIDAFLLFSLLISGLGQQNAFVLHLGVPFASKNAHTVGVILVPKLQVDHCLTKFKT